ncbi:MAG: hypothetical protein V4793_04705 [Paraburkholderia tropica]|uniref:hypothetical protein n=1 Tax=Burkholderia gladioli TaxID=28095 RepID=UPI0009B83D45|nr:hypothetical protein [Burkholderia gladioli]
MPIVGAIRTCPKTAAIETRSLQQVVVGHGLLQTATIYVNAEQQRMRQESAKYHARLVERNLK